jgi:hypothetical protein
MVSEATAARLRERAGGLSTRTGAFIAEMAQTIGGNVLVEESGTTAMSLVRPDMEATPCPN